MLEGQLIKYLRESKNITQQGLGDKVGVSKQSISQYENGDTTPKLATLKKIADALEVSLDDLSSKGLPRKPDELKKTNRKVPYYEIDVSASVVELFTDSAIEAPSSELSVPGLEDCDFAVPVYGNSMYPIYENGTIIVCKEIGNKQLINYGEVYFIVTRDYRMVKRLQRGNKESTILAESENQEKRANGLPKYEPLELPVDEILKLYLVKGCVKRNQL